MLKTAIKDWVINYLNKKFKMRKLDYIFVGMLFIFYFNGEVLAQDCSNKLGKYDSGASRVNLIELYTSEGCSSCPPAEKWVNSLRNHKGVFKNFIPIAFHVNYWDYIGHKDTWAKSEFTKRQRSYASEWGKNGVYTPGFVLNGKEWRTTFRKVPDIKGKDTGRLTAVQTPKKRGEYTVRYSQKGEYHLFLAILKSGIETKVKKGENAGKTLNHNFVAISLQKFPFKDERKINIDKELLKNNDIVFWLEKTDTMGPIQSTGGCIAENIRDE